MESLDSFDQANTEVYRNKFYLTETKSSPSIIFHFFVFFLSKMSQNDGQYMFEIIIRKPVQFYASEVQTKRSDEKWVNC